LDSLAGIKRARLWAVMKRFFATVADVVRQDNPAFAEKLRRATPHWTRHTHATHALHGGAELTAVRDNLRHSPLATTSMYLHSDDVQRARRWPPCLQYRPGEGHSRAAKHLGSDPDSAEIFGGSCLEPQAAGGCRARDRGAAPTS
jgi:hypothetical protein